MENRTRAQRSLVFSSLHAPADVAAKVTTEIARRFPSLRSLARLLKEATPAREISNADRGAIARGRADLRNGRSRTLAQIKKRYKL